MNGTEIIALLSNNLPEVMSVVNCVAGALFTAIFLRKNTSTKEFEKIKAGKFGEVADILLESGKMTYTEYYKANNFLDIAKKADEFFSEMNSSNSSKIYDFDWFFRFYEAASTVSDATMQELWAKILAGEVSEPSTFSFKTIDVLKNISKKDAELFTKVCAYSFVLGNTLYLPREDEFHNAYDILYTDVMKLNELGLMFNDGTIRTEISVDAIPKVLVVNNELLMTISSKNGENIKISINQYPFTEAGQDIASLISQRPSDDTFIEYGKLLSEKNNNCTFSIYKVIEREGDDFTYSDKNLLDIS